MEYKRALVLAPHTDDAELGCGGTIARMVQEGVQVYVAAFSIAEESLPKGAPRDTLKHEFIRALRVLQVPEDNHFVYDYPVRRLSSHRQEVLEDVVALRQRVKPDLVMLPSGNDVHQDHQVLYAEGVRAFKHISVIGYELPWNHISFSAQAFMVLSKEHVERKWLALKSYESQLELNRFYFTQEFTESLARVRGTQVQAQWAEAFEVLRVKW